MIGVGLGDVNNDSFADFALWDSRQAVPPAIIFGKADFDTQVSVPYRDFVAANGVYVTGQTVSAIGDTNGDGLADFLVYTAHNTSAFYVVHGSSSLGVRARNISLANAGAEIETTIPCCSYVSQWFTSYLNAFDINGDGMHDMWFASMATGRAEIVFGSRHTASPRARLLVTATGQAEFPFDVSGVGDINGDGVDDVIFGARGSASKKVAGRAFVLFGRNYSTESVTLGATSTIPSNRMSHSTAGSPRSRAETDVSSSGGVDKSTTTGGGGENELESPSAQHSSGSAGPIVAAAVIGGVVAIGLVVLALWYLRRKGSRRTTGNAGDEKNTAELSSAACAPAPREASASPWAGNSDAHQSFALGNTDDSEGASRSKQYGQRPIGMTGDHYGAL